jgi:hypothetical protein
MMDNFPFVELPLVYSVAVDGEVVRTGQMEDLVQAPFIVHEFRKNGGVHQIDLKLTAAADIASDVLGRESLVAVEYVH